MSYLEILPGAAALPRPRLQRRARDIGARNVRAVLVHFVLSNDQLTDQDEEILNQLLTYGYSFDAQDSLSQELQDFIKQNYTPKTDNVRIFYKVPRVGTISPWSSQATAIAQSRGLTKVARIEHGIAYLVEFESVPAEDVLSKTRSRLHDRMTEEIVSSLDDVSFDENDPSPVGTVDLSNATEGLKRANRDLGLALDQSEMEYLVQAYSERIKRDPTDVELYMFAQVNSEHCRHKQFNAMWTINGLRKERSLFQWIRSTYQKNPHRVVSAYSDNAAVFEGVNSVYFSPQVLTSNWEQTKEVVHYIGKVETHNHPTAISPYPGAATGSGGEIRDEGAVGRGSRPKAGLSAYFVSDLLIPENHQPWELDVGRPPHIASSLDIMIDAPLGSCDYNNEFGRPALITDFNTLTLSVPTKDGKEEIRGYHKPVMAAGGVGTVRPRQALKEKGLVKPGDWIIVLGGPAMLIGLGGGAASSVQSGDTSEKLDFASVQRGNAEVQRRAQEVINTCAYDTVNPISSIHDVGAGGLSNALTELVHDSGLGADFELRDIDNVDKGMSPLEIWCCEAQERYVLAVTEDKLARFKEICQRERCGYSVVGKATGADNRGETKLLLTDRDPPVSEPVNQERASRPIELDMSVLFGKPPQMSRIVSSRPLDLKPFDSSLESFIPENPGPIFEAVSRVLHLPSVGSRSFMITIGDRSVGGLTVRDQMVGPWQTPVAEVAVTATALERGIKTGEAMATGCRPSLALILPAASVRMAVAECLMKLAASDLAERLRRVHFSANWMAASSHPGEGAALYEAVQAVSEFCQRLGISIPVGKDSMSMKMTWKDEKRSEDMAVTSPVTLYATAFGLVRNISNTFTPALRRPEDISEETLLMFVDLSVNEDSGDKAGSKALGGSALAQTFKQLGDDAPDVRDEGLFRDFIDAMEQLHDAGIVLAYHTRGAGGLIRAIAEMMFAGRCGAEIGLEELVRNTSTGEAVSALFNEELGAVFQIRKKDEVKFKAAFSTCGPPPGLIKRLGRVPRANNQKLTVMQGSQVVYSRSRADLQQDWASTSWAIQRLRDDVACADSEFSIIRDDADPGLTYNLTFNPNTKIPLAKRTWSAPFASLSSPFQQKPRVAILREQGVNGQAEMAFAFQEAGFLPVDVHMSDLEAGRHSLAAFKGLAACGGFSYGDVLGAGRAWASAILLNPGVKAQFAAFFARSDTFTLGVCNGCQMLSHVKELIPGAARWPTFQYNASERYEARVCMVRVAEERGGGVSASQAPSVFLNGMGGSALPVVVAHGEGRAEFAPDQQRAAAAFVDAGLAPLRYTDNYLEPTERYPANPNGSPLGIAAVRSVDGRALAMMPHPERAILKECCSWAPPEQSRDWGEFGPWVRLFKSARAWVGA